mmetsp:Transcript_20920/g.28787  ORF Transcript_20920/g.28787 Transcript_20920/m.28787 type:complete len:289 (+) Transcript_20920:1019-1885(+)|eukprot:CAMPEP_0170072582 /NCGR_PEP_ID=MMETSP0019_2-20121128/10187_1 /TAXON_ID=98059 /ORGANISM="Dinobryon sp., Strain UTEXLB2267" /LENGTH=288 /DNA_ID=CAMNT_0010281631 /DNA_START=1049 /DNA_END=1915 /DNA_ORIENTATION=-
MSDHPSSLSLRARSESCYIQQWCAGLAICFATAAVIMTAYWANNTDKSKGFLGGLNWGKSTFNWHPVLMVSGLVFALVVSTVSFTIIPLPSSYVKYFHAFFHTATIVCICIGISAVATSNNFLSKNSEGKYGADLWSLHSIAGIIAICLLAQNYVVGAVVFIFNAVNTVGKVTYLPNHNALGVITLTVVLGTILSGLMEVAEELECEYAVTRPDTDPALSYYLLSSGCQLLNGIGIVVIAAICLAMYAVLTKQQNWESEAERLNNTSKAEIVEPIISVDDKEHDKEVI